MFKFHQNIKAYFKSLDFATLGKLNQHQYRDQNTTKIKLKNYE